MPLEITTSLKKMLALEGRFKVIQGATSSGKTYGIVPIIWDRCLAEPYIRATIVAETMPALKDGCIDIFKTFMMEEGRWRDHRWNGTDFIYTAENHSKLQFKSFDSVGKAKASGKRRLLFLNESNHIPYPIADALIIRSDEIWMDFNADSEFWAHTEIIPRENASFLKLTYKDNEAISPAVLEDLMHKKARAEEEERSGQKGYFWNWWQVYGLGEVGNLQGAVFNNWRISDKPPHARLLGYGMDYGYANDPTALVAVYYADNEYWLDEVIYKTGLMPNQLSALMTTKGVGRYDSITADSAELKTNEQLRFLGWRIIDAKKGAGSVNFGIAKMQELVLNLTPKSENLINEFRNYTWATDREGKGINKPIDKFNHGIDATRYYFEDKFFEPDAPRFYF